MDEVPQDTEIVSGVANLQHVPLSELIRARKAQIRQPERETDAGEFNSSV
jgi:hypothetical protein